jgi:MFS family permease
LRRKYLSEKRYKLPALPSLEPPARSVYSGRLRGVRLVSRALGWLVLSAFLHFASFYYLAATLPLYVLELGGSTYHVGLINGTFALTSLLVRPFFGAWMDRTGRKAFLIAGAGIYVVAALGYLPIRSVQVLLWWRAFHALGLATFSTAAASLAGDLAPAQRRGTTMGTFGLAQAGALTVGPAAGLLLQRTLGYTGLFVATAGTALAALACALPIPSGGLPAARHPGLGRRGGGQTFLRATALPAGAQFAASAAYGAIVSFVAVVAQNRGLDTVGIFFALFALSSLGARPLAGNAYDRRGPAIVLVPAFLAVAAGLALLAVGGGHGLFLLAGVLAGAGIGGTHTTLVARLIDRAPSGSRATSVAGFTASWELGVGAGSILTGRLADTVGFPVTFLAVAALSVLGLAILPWLRR